MPERTGRRGLLIDYAGVLTTSVGDAFRAFAEAAGLPPRSIIETFEQAHEAGDDSLHSVEVGTLEPAAFARRFAAVLTERTGVLVEADRLIEGLFAGIALDHEMLAAVAEAREAGVRTALLSNSWGVENYPRTRLEPAFDTMVISGEVGLRKPDPAIFRLAAERLGLQLEECAFVDDLRGNVDAARALGMAALLHRDTPATVAWLRAVLAPGG